MRKRDRKRKSRRNSVPKQSSKFPLGTVCLYGPDDKVTTKMVASVFARPDAEPILERWVGTNVKNDPKVIEQIKQLFVRNRVKQVVMTDGNLGCPHEEGEDFLRGGDCPFARFGQESRAAGGKCDCRPPNSPRQKPACRRGCTAATVGGFSEA